MREKDRRWRRRTERGRRSRGLGAGEEGDGWMKREKENGEET